MLLAALVFYCLVTNCYKQQLPTTFSFLNLIVLQTRNTGGQGCVIWSGTKVLCEIKVWVMFYLELRVNFQVHSWPWKKFSSLHLQGGNHCFLATCWLQSLCLLSNHFKVLVPVVISISAAGNHHSPTSHLSDVCFRFQSKNTFAFIGSWRLTDHYLISQLVYLPYSNKILLFYVI